MKAHAQECREMSKSYIVLNVYGESWVYNDSTCLIYTVPIPNAIGWYQLNLKLAGVIRILETKIWED